MGCCLQQNLLVTWYLHSDTSHPTPPRRAVVRGMYAMPVTGVTHLTSSEVFCSHFLKLAGECPQMFCILKYVVKYLLCNITHNLTVKKNKPNWPVPVVTL